MLKCNCPGCGATLAPQDARVPALAAIRRKTGGKVTVAALAEHVLCKKHGAFARRSGVEIYPYAGTVAELERREAQRNAAHGFFQLYAPLREIKAAQVRG